MSYVEGNNDHNHWHDPNCDHKRAAPLDFGPVTETPEEFASRTLRIALDPERINARKFITPAFRVPRHRPTVA